MYFFFHLFSGIVLGFLIADLLHDRRWIIPCAIGAVLPDVTDKPIGHILFQNAIGYGRIYGHTLIICGILMVLGIACWKYRKTPVVLAVAAGLLSHQLLDLMWREPVNWLYPLLGQFRGKMPPDYLFVLLRRELHNPSEWILAVLIVAGVLLYRSSRQTDSIISGTKAVWEGLLAAGALLFFVLSGVTIGTGLYPVRGVLLQSLRYFGWTKQAEFIAGGIVFALCAYGLRRLRSEFQKRERTEPAEGWW